MCQWNSKISCSRLTSNHVIQQLFVGMPALELSLPAVVMCVNESRTDYFVSTINDLNVRRCCDIFRNGQNIAVLDKNVGSGRNDMIICAVD